MKTAAFDPAAHSSISCSSPFHPPFLSPFHLSLLHLYLSFFSFFRFFFITVCLLFFAASFILPAKKKNGGKVPHLAAAAAAAAAGLPDRGPGAIRTWF